MRDGLLCLGLTLLLAGLADIAAAGSDDDAIRQMLTKTFDKPEARLVVDPVVVANDHAIADWTQETVGGRALLVRKAGQWAIILCSGDAIKSADAMRRAGVPASDAAKLAAGLESAEKAIPADRLALLASFEGTVSMEADGGHPPVAHGAGADHPTQGHSGATK